MELPPLDAVLKQAATQAAAVAAEVEANMEAVMCEALRQLREELLAEVNLLAEATKQLDITCATSDQLKEHEKKLIVFTKEHQEMKREIRDHTRQIAACAQVQEELSKQLKTPRGQPAACLDVLEEVCREIAAETQQGELKKGVMDPRGQEEILETAGDQQNIAACEASKLQQLSNHVEQMTIEEAAKKTTFSIAGSLISPSDREIGQSHLDNSGDDNLKCIKDELKIQTCSLRGDLNKVTKDLEELKAYLAGDGREESLLELQQRVTSCEIMCDDSARATSQQHLSGHLREVDCLLGEHRPASAELERKSAEHQALAGQTQRAFAQRAFAERKAETQAGDLAGHSDACEEQLAEPVAAMARVERQGDLSGRLDECGKQVSYQFSETSGQDEDSFYVPPRICAGTRLISLSLLPKSRRGNRRMT